MYGLGGVFQLLSIIFGATLILVWYWLLHWYKKKIKREISDSIFWIPVTIIMIIVLILINSFPSG